jgi:DHA1 family inner membrane transport protein
MDRRLIWLAAGSFAVGTVGFVFSTLLPLISEDVHVSIAQAGYLISTFSLAYAIGAPVLSALVGAADRRLVLAAALLVFVGGNLLASQSQSFGFLFLAPVVMGAAGGLFAATAQATAISMAGPEDRARAIAVVVGGTTFAVALGAPLASQLATMFGWRGAFLAVGALGILCAVILWWRLPARHYGPKLTLSERLAALRRPGVALALLVTFVHLSGAFSVISYFGAIAIDGAGLTRYALPVLLLAFGAGAVVGNGLGGYLSDKYGNVPVIVWSMVLASTLCVGISAVLLLLPDSLAGPALIALMVPWGMIGWAFMPAQVSRIVGLAPDVAGLTLSLNVSALYFGVAFGTFVGGRVLEFGSVEEIGLAGAAMSVTALAMFLYSLRRGPRLAAAA